MDKYKKLHLWLLIPFFIAVLGFMRSYFLNFLNASWGNHVHGISATLWFLFVIIQPYLATHGHLKKHKLYGKIGMFLAGAVFASALVMIPENIRFAQTDFDPWVAPDVFLYGVSFFDLISITGFAFSVIMAIIKSKNMDEHAIWMISSVLWALMPALARFGLIFSVWFGQNLNFAELAMITTPAILITAGIIIYKLKRWHPAMVAVIIGHISVYLIIPLGKSQTWIEIATALFSFKQF
ncbi:hypothetical protein [Gracilimonas sediminicola]|uniref:Uncharacterized protein n=1 Tax=Gracilimonas sediminicola TaxID=2952158 RepID=A0A9X2RH21_9BACT|nr:hypothetical protein [Gracilimonas sediminicola]MCP9291928.1 hypothetical protein [Gracilimonas sediminicola]